MADFRRRPPHELEHLKDQELVDYLDEAREAGATAALKEALGFLAFRFEGVIKARVAAKVPSEDIDDVAMEAMHSVIRSGFDGKLIAQFGAFVRTVTQRRIADYHRDREGDPGANSIDGRGEEDERGVEPPAPDESGGVVVIDAVERVLGGRSELHQRVIRLYGPGVCGFDDLPAADVCERLAEDGDSMSVDNVAQIWSRFKRDLQGGSTPEPRQLLEEFAAAFEAGDGPNPRDFVQRADEGARQETEALIDRYLMTAPRRAWDPVAYESSLAKVAVDQVFESMEGVSGSWPELLPSLRKRARLKRREVVERLAGSLGVGEEPQRVEKVGRYYHEMEHGLLPADGRLGREVIDALAAIVGASVRADPRGRRGSDATVDGGGGAVFARMARPTRTSR